MGIETKSEDARGDGAPQASITSRADLSQIATEIEAFLGEWVARLEGVLDYYANSSNGDAMLQDRIAEFEEVQRRWDETRRQEVQQIQETTVQLSAAWDRLEDEQRRILQAQESLPPRVRERPQAETDKADAVIAAEPPAKVADGHSAGDLEPQNTPSVSRDLAVRQFQQLRRQMGIHTS